MTVPREALVFAELVVQVKAGDDRAMAELMTRYAAPMRRTARQLIGRLLQAQLDSVDLVQSVQIILWLGLRAGKLSATTPEGFLALARTLLQRKIARYWRTLKAQQMTCTIDGPLAGTLVDQKIYDAPDHSDPQRRAELDDLADHFLSRLDDLDRQLVKLRFEGYSTADAARHLQLDPGFLRVRLGRLRKRFADLHAMLASRSVSGALPAPPE